MSVEHGTMNLKSLLINTFETCSQKELTILFCFYYVLFTYKTHTHTLRVTSLE